MELLVYTPRTFRVACMTCGTPLALREDVLRQLDRDAQGNTIQPAMLLIEPCPECKQDEYRNGYTDALTEQEEIDDLPQ